MNHCLICMNALDEGVTLKEYLFEEDIICGNCRHRFIKNDGIYTYGYLRVHAFYRYDDFLESLLYQFKEGCDVALENVFLWKYRKKMVDIFRHRQCVIMPSSEDKLKSRGFHHLKKMLACCEVEVCDCFIKTKNYKQSLQRAQNREKIHSVIQRTSFPEKDFYLFDDVVTSGHTLLAAAALLRKKDEIMEAYALSVHPRFVEMCDKQQL